MTPPPELTIRASSLTDYPDCNRRWAAKQLGREIEAAGYRLRQVPRAIGAAAGSATHAAVAYDLTRKMETGALAPQREVEEIGVAALEAEIADGVAWDDASPRLSDAQLQVISMTRSYRQHVAPTVMPIAVEQRLKARRPSGIIVSGQSDMIVAEPATLEDLKTGKLQRVNLPQYGTYTRLLRSHGRPVVAIKERYVQRVAVGKAQPEPVTIDYDVAVAETATEAVLRRIERDVDEFARSGDPDAFLANPASLLCSDRFCPAHSTRFCRLHKGSH